MTCCDLDKFLQARLVDFLDDGLIEVAAAIEENPLQARDGKGDEGFVEHQGDAGLLKLASPRQFIETISVATDGFLAHAEDKIIAPFDGLGDELFPIVAFKAIDVEENIEVAPRPKVLHDAPRDVVIIVMSIADKDVDHECS